MGFDSYFRSSKSMIINLSKIIKLEPTLGGRISVTFENNERLIVSRQYVRALKEMLEIYFLSFILSFTHHFISCNHSKTSSYFRRLLLNASIDFLEVTIFALIFSWLPDYSLITIVIALFIYIFTSLIIILGFYIIYYVEKSDLNKKLQIYKEGRGLK